MSKTDVVESGLSDNVKLHERTLEGLFSEQHDLPDHEEVVKDGFAYDVIRCDALARSCGTKLRILSANCLEVVVPVSAPSGAVSRTSKEDIG